MPVLPAPHVRPPHFNSHQFSLAESLRVTDPRSKRAAVPTADGLNPQHVDWQRRLENFHEARSGGALRVGTPRGAASLPLAASHCTAIVTHGQSGQNRWLPERFVQEALGHNSKAVHRAYAKRALIKIPSLEQYERESAAKMEQPNLPG